MSASQSTAVGTFPAARPGALAQRAAAEGAGSLAADVPSQQQRMLERAWAEHAASLASLAVGLGLAREQAADVLQDVYVTALRRPPPAGNDVDLVRWLFRVTANRCHLEHRRRGRWRRLWTSLAGAWQANGHADGVAIGELRREVDAALARLADDDRLLVVLRYFVDLNSREIAEIVEQPESTVRSRLRAARQKLAQWLEDWNEE